MSDHVLPHLPVRQWVLSLPKRLRPFLHHQPDVATAVLRIFLGAIRSELRSTSPGAPADARIGAVSFPQRFGSSLNPHFHFHVLALDGVFSEDHESAAVRFHEASELAPAHWQEVERTVQRRVLRAFSTRGLLEPDAARTMLSWQASGGFSVEASVRMEGDDRAGVERPVRSRGSTRWAALRRSPPPTRGSSTASPGLIVTDVASSCSPRWSYWSGSPA